MRKIHWKRWRRVKCTRKAIRDNMFREIISPIRRGKTMAYVRARCNVYLCLLRAYMCMYTILNPQGKRVETQWVDIGPFDSYTHAYHGRTYTRKFARYTECTYIRMRYMCVVCVSRENRPRSKACPWYIEPARYRTICLENNGNARRAVSEWIFKD